MKHIALSLVSTVVAVLGVILSVACEKDVSFSFSKGQATVQQFYNVSIFCPAEFVDNHKYEKAKVIVGTTESSVKNHYGTSYYANSRDVSSDGFTVYLDNLKPSTNYYYCSSIIEGNTTKYGPVCSFSTPSAPKPTMETSSILINSIKYYVSIPSMYGINLDNVGVECSTTSSFSNIISNSNGYAYAGSSYYITVSQLTANTTYYCRPYYQYKNVKYYGITSTVSTPSAPKPTMETSSTLANSIKFYVSIPKMSGNMYGINLDNVGVECSTTSSFSNIKSNNNGNAYAGSSYYITVSQLTANTIYYCRPYYQFNGVKYYGNVSTVTTIQTASNSIILSSSSSYPWTKSTYGNKYNGLKSSNNSIHNSNSYSTLTITRSSSFSLYFNYYVSSESSYDKLTIKVDGNTIANEISGSSTGTYSNNLSSGTHTIYMEYSKDGSNSTNNDCGRIYDIKINNSYISNSDIIVE